MLSSLKIGFALFAFSLFNATLSFIVFSVMFEPIQEEKFSFVLESTSQSAAMLEMQPDERALPPNHESLPPVFPDSEILKSLEELLANIRKQESATAPRDKSNLDESRLFTAPGPKKNLI